jgi:hypothetical protein
MPVTTAARRADAVQPVKSAAEAAAANPAVIAPAENAFLIDSLLRRSTVKLENRTQSGFQRRRYFFGGFL